MIRRVYPRHGACRRPLSEKFAIVLAIGGGGYWIMHTIWWAVSR